MQSESGIIATLIVHPDFILWSENFKKDYFYDGTNACLYWAINELYKTGITNIDTFNLLGIINTNAQVKKQILKEFSEDNIKKLIELSRSIARHSVEEYQVLIRRVVELSLRRDLAKELQICEKYCYEDRIDGNELQKRIYDTIDRVSIDYLDLQGIPEYANIVDSLWEETKNRQEGGNICGYSSKFKTLNDYCNYEKGELVIVAAHRKEGKSIFCLNELVHQLENNVSCLYIDTEMSTRLFNERLLSHLTGIKVKDIKSGSYDKSKENLIKDKREWIKTRKFTHQYLPAWTKEEVYILAKNLKRQKGMNFLIFDYFKSREGTDTSAVYHELGNMINFIKNDIVGELELSGLGAAQLNRGGEIGDSYKIEQYASAILNLKRKTAEEITKDGGNEYGNYKLFVKLNRLGDQMSDITSEYIDLNFNGGICRFEEAKQHIIEDNPFI